MSLQQAKRAEASAQLQAADKALAKRSFFRSSPDYLTAAPLLEKAGELFRLGGDFEASKDAFKRCADAQQHNQSPFRAAQAWENVAKTALQQLKTERAGQNSAKERTYEAKQAFETASSCYVDMGELGKAADALVKGAQACEAHGSEPDSVLPLYYRACDLLEAQDKPHLAVETFRKTLGFLAKAEKYADAVKILGRLVVLYQAMDQPHNVHKMHLSQVILLLASGDVSAADALYSRCLQDDTFLASDDCALAEDLVRAFKMGNEELLQTTVRKPGFMALDNQIGRICRKLSVYGAADAAPARQQHRSAPSSGGMQQSSKQRNPFAPSARPPQRNPFAPSSRAPPAPVPASSLDSEYDVASSEAPTASSTDLRDSDYDAALAAALGEVSVSKEERQHVAEPTKDTHEEYAPSPPPPSAKKTAAPAAVLSPNSPPSPPLVRADRNTRMDYDFDELEFSMPEPPATEPDSLEFTMTPNESAGPGMSGYSDSFEAAAAPAPKAEASKPAPKPAAPSVDDDMFDLT